MRQRREPICGSQKRVVLVLEGWNCQSCSLKNNFRAFSDLQPFQKVLKGKIIKSVSGQKNWLEGTAVMVYGVSGIISLTQVSFAGHPYSPLYHSRMQGKEEMADMDLMDKAEIPEIKAASSFAMIKSNKKDQKTRVNYQSNFSTW